jgi:pimeloyl-ACP methyl ester carboxylesterase
MERFASANSIEIAYETFGDPGDPAMLLIMGLGAQLIHWDPEFCELLASRGFFVVRFDNRDVGRSSRMKNAPVPELAAAFAGDVSAATYTLDDMADDAVGLLDALEIDTAHVFGASMGGMIAQTVASRHPERVLSLASMMSTTGDRSVGQPTQAALAVLLAPSPPDRDSYIEFHVNAFKAIGSPDLIDEEFLRRRAEATYDRSHYPDGVARQLLAVIASGDRTEALRAVNVPTLIIHGSADPLIQVSGGEATARAVPGAELLVIEGMGHDLPRQFWKQIVDALTANARRARAGVPRGVPAGASG